MECADVM